MDDFCPAALILFVAFGGCAGASAEAPSPADAGAGIVDGSSLLPCLSTTDCHRGEACGWPREQGLCGKKGQCVVPGGPPFFDFGQFPVCGCQGERLHGVVSQVYTDDAGTIHSEFIYYNGPLGKQGTCSD